MTSTECDGQVFGLDFISGMDQWNKPGPYAACPSQTALLAMSLGQCGDDDDDDDAVCAPNAASCGKDTTFVGPDTVGSRDDCTVATTKFGSCGGECRWSPEDCSASTRSWTFPSKDCTCDKVHVGACVNKIHNDFVICAVNAEACNPDISYYVPVDRVAAELGIACSLCRGSVNTSNAGNTEFTTSITGTRNQGGISVGGVAAALIAGCMVFVAFVVVLAYAHRSKYPPLQKKRTLPATVVSNNNAHVEEDDVSVL